MRLLGGILTRLMMVALVWISISGFAFFTGESTRAFRDVSRRAKAALQNRQWNDALVALEQGKRQFPRSARIRLALAYLYRQVNLLPQARESASWASKHSAGADRDLSFRELAWTNYRMFLFEDALTALGQIKKPLSVDYAFEARLRGHRGEWPLALAAIEKVQEKSAAIDFWKGWILWHLDRRLEGMQLMRGSSFELSNGVFGSELSSINDPWILLANLAQKSLRGLRATDRERSAVAQIVAGRVSGKAVIRNDGAIEEHDQAWVFLEALGPLEKP